MKLRIRHLFNYQKKKIKPMSKEEITSFLSQGIRTAKYQQLARMGPIILFQYVSYWMVKILFLLHGINQLKQSTSCGIRVSICVDDQKPLYSFVTMYGNATITLYNDNPDAQLKWVKKMQKDMAKEILLKENY